MVTIWFLIVVLMTALLGVQPAAAQSPPPLPQPPQAFIDTTYAEPTGGTTWNIPAGDAAGFQNALTNSAPGDVIILHPGTAYSGSFTLPEKFNPNNKWIYVRSSEYSNLPGPGQRVQLSNVPSMATISDNTGNVAISVANRANYWRFVGIEITTAWILPQQYWAIVDIPLAGSDRANAAHHIYFDRCYIHGTSAGYVRNGISAQGAWIAVVDSYVSDIHQANDESYDFLSSNGAGPFKIVNNELEAAGLHVFFGGRDPDVTGLVPSDIEVRGNHFFKPQSYTAFCVKNHLELKNAQRVLIDGNVFEYNWHGCQGQDGFSIVLTPRNEHNTPAGCDWCVVQDVTITHNIIRHTEAGIYMLGYDNNFASQQLQRVLIQNNLFVDIRETSPGGGSPGFLFLMSDGPTDVVIDHNTAFQTRTILEMNTFNPLHWPAARFTFTNNITPDNKTDGCDGVYGNAPPTCGAAQTMNAYFSSYAFSNNVIPCGPSPCSPWPPQNYPPGNFFPASIDPGVGFVNYSGGDYHLAASSPYKNQATDLTDPGANIDALNTMTGNAVSGAGRPPQTVLWTNIANAVATGSGTIQGTATSQGCPTCQNNSGAVSLQQLSSGDGYLQFTVPDTVHEYVVSIGLVSNGWAGHFGLHFTGTGSFEVREGSWTLMNGPTPFSGGDVFQIAIINGVVKYLRNGSVFYTSTAGPQYPIEAYVSLWSAYAVVSNGLIMVGIQ